MGDLLLFTDGSVNAQSGVGFGACLLVEDPTLSLDTHRTQVRLKRFENTTSTRLELQVLLWILGELKDVGVKLIIHTDSQNILGLIKRRSRLEQNDFHSKAGKLLNNSDLYREFYDLIDQLDCRLVKVKGHKLSEDKDGTDLFFTLVDRASREALRKDIEQQ